MENQVIGIKIANGSFFPILSKDESVRKQVILTTVRDDQASVQIDLYQGSGMEMEDPRYIGSLMIDNIGPAPGGDPEIELQMGIDTEGQLTSRARDRKSDEEQSLRVNLRELPEEATYDVPEFQVDEAAVSDETELGDLEFPGSAEEPSPTAQGSDEARYLSNGYENQETKKPTPSGPPLGLFVGVGAILLVAVFLLILLVIRPGQPAAPKTALPAAPTPEAAAKAQTPAPTVPAAPVQPTPKAGEPVAKPGSVGVWYSAVRGDNLWNLSKSFYRNPLLFLKIAQENAIGNPDFILEGQRLYIPDVETGKR